MTIDRLSEPGKEPVRAYDSPRRRAQAEATRVEIAAAARRLFAERGWAGTRVRDVAREAGVAEPTVYAAYGNKLGLARAVISDVEASAAGPPSPEDLVRAHPEPVAQIGELVAFDRRLYEHGGDVLVLMRDTGPAEPELHAAYQEGRARGDAFRRAVFSHWPPDAFADDIDAALDTYAALCTVDAYRVMTRERGRTPEDVERWWHRSLVRLLLR
jgi:AcrR family transcriptional regulator